MEYYPIDLEHVGIMHVTTHSKGTTTPGEGYIFLMIRHNTCPILYVYVHVLIDSTMYSLCHSPNLRYVLIRCEMITTF